MDKATKINVAQELVYREGEITIGDVTYTFDPYNWEIRCISRNQPNGIEHAATHEELVALYDKCILTKEGQTMDEKGVRLYQEAVAHVAAQRDKAMELADELIKDVHHWQDLCDQEHAAFVQAAEERDTYIRECHSKSEKLRQVYHELHLAEQTSEALRQQLQDDHDRMQEAVDKAESILDELCDMVAEDCDMDDIAAVLIQYRSGSYHENYRLKYACCIEMLQAAMNADDDQVVYDTVRAVLALDIVLDDHEPEDSLADCKWKVMVVDNQGDDPIFTGWFKDYDMARESVDLMVSRGCYEAWVEELQ